MKHLFGIALVIADVVCVKAGMIAWAQFPHATERQRIGTVVFAVAVAAANVFIVALLNRWAKRSRRRSAPATPSRRPGGYPPYGGPGNSR